MQFFVGLHHPSDAWHFDRVFISVNRLRDRRSSFRVKRWIMDSGAFSTITRHGDFQTTPEAYAREILRWKATGHLLAAVTQDYMCEPYVLDITGLTVADHQRMTIERYDATRAALADVYLLPVLQGWTSADYAQHVQAYGSRLASKAWVGVGSVCKRNAKPESVLEILTAIKAVRPDLRLHGFGLKTTALAIPAIRRLLFSADSMAWSYAARREGRGPDANKWQEAKKFVDLIEGMYMPRQVESTITKLLKFSDTLTPEQILDAIDILRHRYAQTRPGTPHTPRKRKVRTQPETEGQA